MESKKINQLATELTPALSDLTIIGDPTTGISKKITLSQMASLFTGTVEEYANLASFPLVGVADTIYIALDTNVLYRWDTGLTSYVELSPNIINSLVFNDANGFDGTISLVGSVATLTITTALTTGSVGFIGASGALLQDNANFFWDDTNNRLGIGTNAPTTAIDTFGSGIITRVNGTSTNNAFIGFASAGSNKWSVGNVQSDHRFRIYSEANSSERFTILPTGEVGIGINNPTTKLHIDTGSSALIANLDADVSVAKSISFRSDNSARINLEVSGTESGSNAGANLNINTYSDAGALLHTALTIVRSNGNATFSGLLTANNDLRINFNPGAGNGLYFNDVTSSAIMFYILPANYVGSAPYNNNILKAANNSNITFETGTLERMRITSGGNIGFGTNNPSYLLHAYTTDASNARIYLQGTTNFVTTQLGNTSGAFYMAIDSSTGGGFSTEAYARLIYSTGAYPLITYVNGAERMRITSSGNVGIGVNPAAWASPTAGKVIQIGNRAAIFSYNNTTNDSSTNVYFDGSEYRYLESANATLFRQNSSDGSIVFLNAASGTSGAVTAFTERMRIASNGNITTEGLFLPSRLSYKNQTIYYGTSVVNAGPVTSFTVNLATLLPEVAINGNVVAVYGKYVVYRGAQAESGQFGMSRNSGNTWTSGSFSNQTATGAYSLSSVTGSTNSITFNFNTTVYFACEITCLIS